MTLEREFYGFRMASGKLVSLWRALEFFNPEADTGDHRHEAKAYNYDGWVEQCWSDQTTRWLVFEIHEVYVASTRFEGSQTSFVIGLNANSITQLSPQKRQRQPPYVERHTPRPTATSVHG